MNLTVNRAAVILTYNESIHLRRAIEHVAPFAKETCVIDSYSTDGTADLAESLEAHVIKHPFTRRMESANAHAGRFLLREHRRGIARLSRDVRYAWKPRFCMNCIEVIAQ
jgi:glycosyltransferase involved in cell wall biosynthesis